MQLIKFIIEIKLSTIRTINIKLHNLLDSSCHMGTVLCLVQAVHLSLFLSPTNSHLH